MKFIVADDSIFVRNVLTKTLETYFPEAEITLCKNGVEALEAYQNSTPDWLITDLLMPEMSGQELLVQLQTLEFKGNHIVISADVQKGTRDEVEALGIKAFINKPLTGDKLSQLVELIRGETYDE